MQPQGQYLFQSGCRSVGIVHTIFDRPRSPAWNVATLKKGQSRVLVPYDEPVGDWRFIEQRGAKGNCTISENVLRQLHQSNVARKRGHFWISHGVPQARPASWKSRLFDCGLESVYFPVGNDFVKNGESILRDSFDE